MPTEAKTSSSRHRVKRGESSSSKRHLSSDREKLDNRGRRGLSPEKKTSSSSSRGFKDTRSTAEKEKSFVISKSATSSVDKEKSFVISKGLAEKNKSFVIVDDRNSDRDHRRSKSRSKPESSSKRSSKDLDQELDPRSKTRDDRQQEDRRSKTKEDPEKRSKHRDKGEGRSEKKRDSKSRDRARDREEKSQLNKRYEEDRKTISRYLEEETGSTFKYKDQERSREGDDDRKSKKKHDQNDDRRSHRRSSDVYKEESSGKKSRKAEDEIKHRKESSRSRRNQNDQELDPPEQKPVEIHQPEKDPNLVAIVEPEQPKPTLSAKSSKENGADEVIEEPEVDYDYDDDFEDYDDDDFEEESEEETEDSKMDSGSYERARIRKEMVEVKAAMIRENSAPSKQKGESDKSFQDSGHVSNDDQNQNETRRKPSGKVTFNFASAKQKQRTQKAAGKAKKRGDELLTMIRLDVAKYDLFDLPPIAYEALMGNSNRVQATCQTGEDDLDEELQTEPIDSLEKWTQFPPPPLTHLADPEDHETLWQTLHGVGGQFEAAKFKDYNHETMKSMNSVRLSKFLESASTAMMTLLEEDADRKYGNMANAQDQKDVVFSDKVTLLDTDVVKCLQGKAVKAMAFALDQPSLLLVGHGPSSNDETGSDDPFRSYLTVWNVGSPSQPLHVLVTSEVVQTVAFSPLKASMAFAGMMDGSISVWDLREPYALHQEVVKLNFNDERVHRSPTFTTASNEESTHESPVNGLKPLPPSQEIDSHDNTFQIVSCEELGKVIIWTVLDSVRDSDAHLGLAHWGCVRVVSSVKIELSHSCYDVIFGSRGGGGSNESSGGGRGDLFLGLGNGHLFHGSVHADHKPSPRFYKAELESHVSVRSLAFCPFGEQFILAGSDDGSVRMHSVTSEKPLITWPGSVDGQAILKLIWSPSRPCVFYVLDSNSRLHVWDLGVGDIYPAHTVQFEEKVNIMAVNPELGDSRQKQLLGLGMENGRVEVHHLKADYRASDAKACSKELERFMHYISII